jgi:hypothetical protein
MHILKAARGRITGPFGAVNQANSHVKVHRGVDLGHGDMTPEDLEVRAPQAGRVTAAGPLGTYGNRVEIQHDADWSTLVAHLEQILTHVGAEVAANDLIGEMGNTGTVFVHCHQELRYRGVPVNPALYFVDHIPTSSTNSEEEEMALQIIKEIGPDITEDRPARYGAFPTPEGMTHLDDMDQVNAILVGMGKGEAEAVRGVLPVEFDRIAAALRR